MDFSGGKNGDAEDRSSGEAEAENLGGGNDAVNLGGDNGDAHQDYYRHRVPHQDDRLWRHPSELAAQHRNTLPEPPTLQVAKVAPRHHKFNHKPSRLRVALLASALLCLFLAAYTAATRPADTAAFTATEERLYIAPATTPATQALTEIAAETGLGPGNTVFPLSDTVAKIEVARGFEMVEGAAVYIDGGYLATTSHLIDGADYVIARSLGHRFNAEIITVDSVSGLAILAVDCDPCPKAELASTHHAHRLPIFGSGASTQPISLDYNASFGHDISELETTQADIAAFEIAHVYNTPKSTPQQISVGNGRGGHRISLYSDTYNTAANLKAGAAIFNRNGQVIGLYDHSSASAIPAWLIEAVVEDLILYGQVRHPWLGATYVLDSRGHVIVDVAAGSPASAADLRTGDVVVSVDSVALGADRTLFAEVIHRDIGDIMVLGIERAAEPLTLELTLVAAVQPD